ncbi:hypothetical protein BKA81DRAFT_348891 [Phyllosticta paracitricarpa]
MALLTDALLDRIGLDWIGLDWALGGTALVVAAAVAVASVGGPGTKGFLWLRLGIGSLLAGGCLFATLFAYFLLSRFAMVPEVGTQVGSRRYASRQERLRNRQEDQRHLIIIIIINTIIVLVGSQCLVVVGLLLVLLIDANTQLTYPYAEEKGGSTYKKIRRNTASCLTTQHHCLRIMPSATLDNTCSTTRQKGMLR